MQKGVGSQLLEVDFHDNPKTAQWIIDSKDVIASAIVKAIVATFGIAKKSVTPASPTAPAASANGKLYRVQVGAYAVKSNADAMLAKLKSLGIDGYVKFD